MYPKNKNFIFSFLLVILCQYSSLVLFMKRMAKNIPIIAYTAHDPEVVAKKGLEALDIVDFVLKPFDAEVLILAVNKALKKPTF